MSLKRLMSLTKEEFKCFFDSIDVILSDCDGVLWKETEVITGSPEAVNSFKRSGKRFFYITNNNTKTRSELVEKCRGLNYKATTDEIVCTSFLAAVYLKGKLSGKKAYIVGNPGIAKELEAEGIKHCGIGPDDLPADELAAVKCFRPEPDIGAVIVGFDRYFGYTKLMKAATYLQNPEVHFLGTNIDAHRPSPNDNTFPGTGCFVKAIEVASGRSAVLLGKPEAFMIEYIIDKFRLNPGRTLMIGDNCTTDILLGKRCGFKTLLVLSGVTTNQDVQAMNKCTEESRNSVPDYYVEKLGDVLQLLEDHEPVATA
ncbi:hypothetical protein KM043_013935 [Ampulex compressa]|nr:hypothetical protein KM043_013935 [Ampulex compressa]